MEKEISLFPLNLVAFPGEHLHLHIFEPRYKQLVNDCLKAESTFGIPSYVLNKIEYGTEVRITEVTKVYEDGSMDIKTEGVEVFRVVDYHHQWDSKLYAGGAVQIIDFSVDRDESLHKEIVDKLNDLFMWLKTEQELKMDYEQPMYKVIHKIGLKLDEEYALLSMDSERKRQEYVLKHLKSLVPMLQRAEEARDKIRMNGHFKHLDPLKF
ncbi:MAG: Lon protease-like protein [Cyclobacteriaceae bacterium]|jgi:Lon protease-like protein